MRDIATNDTEPDVMREARELEWTTTDRIEMHWWMRLAPSWTGTDVEHGCTFPERPDLIGPVRARLVATLAEVKARAESQ